MRDGTDYFDDYADRKVSDSKPSGTVCRHCKKPENEHWGAKRHCLARYGKTLTIMDDKFEPLAETVCRCEGADSRGCAIHATPDYKPGGKMWREPAPAEQPRVHKNTYGGNDFLHCNDCGQEWDYRKPGAEPPTCIPVAASPAEGPRQAMCPQCGAKMKGGFFRVSANSTSAIKWRCQGNDESYHEFIIDCEAKLRLFFAAQPVPGAKVEAKQLEIDISNLRFYATMAKGFKWHTDIIHEGVIAQTLMEISDRLAILRPCFQADAPRLDSPKSCDFPFTESCTQFEACIRANRCLKNLPESERAKS